jgi:exodeoxyribonuclease VII large subunit
MQYILSVAETNKYIKEIISKDIILSNLWIKGEISNYKYHYSGHMYFTIKDDTSLLKCVMFRTHASMLKFTPENGLKVIIKGYVSVFERDGQYQLYAEEMQPDGLGNLHLAFEQLKKKLQDEGLFETKRKRKIPFLPRSIGVVTSKTGSVIRDIINILNRRNTNFDLKIFPVAVQGESAPKQIAEAIGKLNEMNCVDVIILARGGGSLEELWAFNEEIVARSIFESDIPVISAVGHETDYTIADFVADMRAPTPSAAAEIVIPESSALEYKIFNLKSRLNISLNSNLKIKRAMVDRIRNSSVFKQPYDMIYQRRMRLDSVNKYLYKSIHAKNEKDMLKFSLLAGKLDALSPLKILSRGYSVVKSKNNGVYIKSIEEIIKNDEIEIKMKDGKANCTVNQVIKEALE